MAQQGLPPPNTARLAITSFCNLLRHHGITSLEPEVVRQAKFDGPVAAPLWHVLHDTVLVVLAGCPSGPTCQAALARQWSEVSLERCGDEEFPHEAAALVIQQLSVWGAPRELLRELGPRPDSNPGQDPKSDPVSGCGAWPCCRSRPLLLALGWLVAAAGLFERRISELEPGPGLRALLPPYPPDSCVSPAVQAAYDNAVREAQEYVQKLMPVAPAAAGGRAGGPRGGGSGSDPFGSAATDALWGEVEAAAQRAVMLCGRIRSRMVTLQAAIDCRNRLSHSLWARQAATAPSSRPLTPYELQLCAQPAMMQRHMAALETATLALLEQQELAAHGALFFEWLGSVLEEEEEEAKHKQQQGGRGRGPSGHRKASEASQAGAAGGGGAMASLGRLPYVMSDAGGRLAAHLEAQLKAALQAAEPELAAARRRADEALCRGPAPPGSGGSGSGARPAGKAAQQQQLGVTLEQFLELAERAVPEHHFTDPQSSSADGGDGGGGAAPGGGGRQGASGLPLLVGGAAAAAVDANSNADTGVWRLPDDLAAALDAVQIAEQRRRSTAEEEGARFRQLRYAALSRYDFQAGPAGAAAGTAGPPGAPPAAAVSAAAETQRLLGVVLAAARPLARTRAAHKAALLAALQDLPEGYLVTGL